MKKIIAASLLALSFSSSAFAAGTVLATNTPSKEGAQIFGGTTADEAARADINPLVKLSTGVIGVVNFAAEASNANQSISYAVFAKHTKGSKIFGTSNDSTNVYWKAETPGALTNANLPSETTNAGFGTGWTSY
ncbi:hypothetical protein GEOBRER4_n1728 [Citrifermentans bremense]|uniref:Uncharacterized protein n=1 Tax=Citrifermentans bremense TaxID=60035 RepID=A0A6S6LY20_9BACT|nr:hypothetical protein [Citrifermentans bremense]BCG46912.1 hypothetical protein GEOBRER4_n1728 [Citrifermentans bremense]